MGASAEEAMIIDYEEGLERFVNKPELYHKFLSKFMQESAFVELQKAMAEEDYEAAFRYAHTMKGNTGNLSLVRLYKATIPLVEALRDGADIEGAKKLYGQVETVFEETIAYLKNIV